ncbi:thioredoxin [Candidatus Poribacteria bacterium]|nr:thioredoxin [Candidatus Poribacteria bacterium]MYA99458.1 thioredoxin [Candidatus Poribacteria bacterium]
MAPVVAEIALEYKDTFVVAKLNSGNNPKTVQKYRLIGHPTYLIFQDGENLGRFGAVPKAEFVQKVLNAIDVEAN